MSTCPSGDVSLIQDEDVLRKLWQDTDDFGKKKEIRAHMYKLREARLRNFYNSGEVSSDIQRTSTTSRTKTTKRSTHADSLDDQSFISMKTKEIRDSESPTKDDLYKGTGKSVATQGWNVVSSNKTSDDGKTFTSSRVATKSGSEKIEGGKMDFAARNEQQTSVFQDGDDKNFVKAVGASSNSVVTQQASGGDEHSSFKSSSTKTSSSSKVVTEQKSSSSNVDNSSQAKLLAHNQSEGQIVSRKTYTSDVPLELKNHPSYVEGKTKVTRETKTLPDGTTVTTTKYEIKGGNASQSTARGQYSTSEHKSSSSVVKSSTSEAPTTTKTIIKHESHVEDLQPATTVSKTIQKQHTDSADRASRNISDSSVTTTRVHEIHESRHEPITSISTTTKEVSSYDTTDKAAVQDVSRTTKIIDDSKRFITDKAAVHDLSKTTKVTVDDSKVLNERFISLEQQDNRNRETVEKQPKAEQPKSPEKVQRIQEPYEQPERRSPIKPGRSELDERVQPAAGQYDTTYNSHFNNKTIREKISMGVSPTHDAFARSLRAVSPDRLSKGSSPSRSFRDSNNSLRSSTSPEKFRHPSRFSPERRSTSPKKTISSETFTCRNQSNYNTLTKKRNTEIDSSTLTRRSTKQKVRSRSPSPTSIASDIEYFKNTSIVTDLDTNETVISQSRPSSLNINRKVTERSPTSPLTDSTTIKTTQKEVSRTNSLRSISPTKEPSDKRPAFKRTDTYEERCRQILGITEDSNKRKSSIDRSVTRKSSSSNITPERVSPTRKSPEKQKRITEFPSQTPKKEKTPTPRQSPEKRVVRNKETSPLKEFPSQIRRSSKNESLEPYPEKTRPRKEAPKISEFPAQTRRSPEKTKQRPYSETPVKGRNVDDNTCKLSEFPSQIRRSPEKLKNDQPRYPTKKDTKEGPKICEFPSQIRRSPERPIIEQQSTKRPETDKRPSQVSEFPSQIRRSPEKSDLERPPTKIPERKEAPKICEFPSQIRRSPEKSDLERPPTKSPERKEAPKICEFPSQIRRTPEKSDLEKPVRSPDHKELKEPSKISEFPSQIRRSPERPEVERPSSRSSDRKEPLKISEFPSQIRRSTEKDHFDQPPEQYDGKRRPSDTPKISEFPSQIRRTPDRVLEPQPKPKDQDESSSSSEDEEDKLKITTDEDIKRDTIYITSTTPQVNQKPVEEPLMVKKFVSQLCKDEEIQKTDLVKKENKNYLNKIILETNTKTQNKTVKKDSAKTRTQIFIDTEKLDTKKTPTKKIAPEKVSTVNNRMTTTVVKRVTSRPTKEEKVPTTIKKTSEKITLYDIESMNKNKQDNRTHIRTHRVDETTRKTVKNIINGDTNKKEIIKRPSTDELKTKRVTERKDFTTVKKTTSTTPKRHVVTTTITVQSKPSRSPTKKAPTTKKLGPKNGHLSSDESITDSLSEEVTTKKQITDKHNKNVRSKISDSVTTTRTKQEKCITTKSIIINNDSVQKEVVVDLQRSKSSREPTPDRICPLPVSDDDDTPRYPDAVVEPDDALPRQKPKRVLSMPIPEGKDAVEFSKITEIEEKAEEHESDVCLLSLDKKISKFSETKDSVVSTSQGVAPKVERPKLEVTEDLESDECLLSVSEKVNKFISTAEQLTTPQDFARPKSPKCQFNSEQEPKRKISLSSIDIKTPQRKSPSPPKQTITPTRRPSNDYTSIKSDTDKVKRPERDGSPKFPDSTPKSTKRSSIDETKSVLSTTSRLRSTESIRKAKAMFENNQTSKQSDILSRPSVFEGRKKTEISKKLNYDDEIVEKSNTRSRSRSPDKLSERYSPRRSQSPDGDIPGYMRPLDRSLRPNSPHRDNINQLNKNQHILKEEECTDVRQTKFGVTLKRTDSGRNVTTTTRTTTKEMIEITEEEIVKIFDLERLEILLERVHDYELRRIIRTQIRLVKKLISEGKLEETIRKMQTKEKTTRKMSTEYQSSYSSVDKKTVRRSQSPDTKPQAKRRSQSPDTKPSKTTKNVTLKTSVETKTKTDDVPEWVKNRNLKSVSERTTSTTKTSTVTSTKKSRSSPVKESRTTDLITSSYGVGPTDENGSPLFGLKALRAQKVSEATKVQGTVIKSQYYSETGKEPVGEVSVTKYSSDPRDLGSDEETTKSRGVTSVTTTQRFGYKDAPSLKSLTDVKKKRVEGEKKTESGTFQRRGSVKAISQKFIETAAETTSKPSYPKAGLILRTSSFKEDTTDRESRESSSEKTSTRTSTTTVTTSSGGESFLTNRSKVTGVQDIISRMKTQDVQEGDSAEDVQARSLLNKFLGAQVILTGIEASTTGSSAKRSTKVTSTVTQGGKPVTKTRVFHHPITDEELETVWEEQILRLLLEESTDYEERKRIRARLRQVMAEQEACTELVNRASQEQTIEDVSESRKSFREGPITTSQVTTRVTTTQQSKKPISPFAKFRQLDKQNSLNSPSTPKTPSGSGPLFKFTDPAVSQSASTIKDRLLFWCRMKTKEYENIQLDNFSTCWADGLAFCALIHHFLPDAFDYHALTPQNRRYNFTLAFKVADEKADIAPLLDVDDMVATRKPDWKCVFTYVQSIYRRFKDED